MSSNRLNEILLKRGRLQERIARQREELRWEAAPLADACDRVDWTVYQAHQAMSFVRSHPVAIGLVIAAIFAYRPKRSWRLAKRGFAVWRMWQSIRARMWAAGIPFV